MLDRSSSLRRIVAFWLIVAVSLTVSLTASHGHPTDTLGDNCQICLASHSSSVAALPAVAQAPVVSVIDLPLISTCLSELSNCALSSDSRAPPSVLS